ncbi:MAG: hypothetical protein HOB58_08320, partial [Nitrospina sp.]|nr:hypothetical protein [Nitrospina sp.]
MLFWSYVEGLLNGHTDNFFTFTVEADNRVIIHLKLLTVNVSLEYFRTWLTFPFEDDTLGCSKELQNSQQISIWNHV